METYLTPKDFLQQIKENKAVSGKFLIPLGDGSVEDMDFRDILFKDVEIHGGDFISGIFADCVFDNVIFNKSTIVGVNFDRCHFKKCTFNEVQQSYSMGNCKIDSFIFTKVLSLFSDIKLGSGEEV